MDNLPGPVNSKNTKDTRYINGSSQLEKGSDPWTTKTTMLKVTIKGINAHLVINPKATRMEQKNSENMVSCKVVATPRPNGSANWLRFSLKLAILVHPCLSIIMDTALLNKKRAKSKP